MTPTLLEVHGKLIKSRIVLHVSIIMMMLIALILRYDIVERGEDLILMEAGFYFSVLFFCWSMLALKVTGPFEKPVSFFGRYSYSIYLFHDALLLQALFDVHLIQLRLPLSLAIVLALLPVLIWFCVASERVAGNLRLWLWKLGKRTILASDGSELQS
jgi:peptidoglycan/LPS O-acetylase OafA/YrhL